LWRWATGNRNDDDLQYHRDDLDGGADRHNDGTFHTDGILVNDHISNNDGMVGNDGKHNKRRVNY
jgi:hypothetical protein